MSDYQPPTHDLSSAAVVEEFYTLVWELSKSGFERRTEERIAISVALKIQPLDMDFHVDGESFLALTRDFSQGGLGFISPEPFDHKHLRLSIPGNGTASIIGRVCYNLPVGDEQPLYLVGVQFVSQRRSEN